MNKIVSIFLRGLSPQKGFTMLKPKHTEVVTVAVDSKPTDSYPTAHKSTRMLRKISVGTVVGSDIKRYLEDGRSVPVMGVVGLVSGYETGSSKFGDNEKVWTKFTGQFVAKNMVTGEQFLPCGVLFLPEPVQGLVRSYLGENASVQIAFLISIVTANTSCGYGYEVDNLDPDSQLGCGAPVALIERLGS